jgi:hypothetical protein
MLAALLKHTRRYVLPATLALVCVDAQHSMAQGPTITAGSQIRFDTTGAPDPLTGSWFQSLGPEEVTIHYGKVRVPEKVEGPLLSPAYFVNWDITLDYGANQDESSVRIISAMRLLAFSDKCGLFFHQEVRRWFVSHDGKVVNRNTDILPDEASEFATFLSPENSGYQNSLLSAAGSKKDWKGTLQQLEGEFSKILFRKDESKRLVLGLVSKEQSKMYLPPVIANITPEVFGEFISLNVYDLRRVSSGELKPHSWPYNSSTAIVVSDGPRGSLIAEGEVEFLLLGWNMLLPNFGSGTRLVVKKGTKPFVLIDSAGNSMRVEKEGAYSYDGSKWSKEPENPSSGGGSQTGSR